MIQDFLRLYGQAAIIGIGSLIGLLTVLIYRARNRHNRFGNDS